MGELVFCPCPPRPLHTHTFIITLTHTLVRLLISHFLLETDRETVPAETSTCSGKVSFDTCGIHRKQHPGERLQIYSQALRQRHLYVSGHSTCSINHILNGFLILFLMLQFAKVNGTEDEINVIWVGRWQKGTIFK